MVTKALERIEPSRRVVLLGIAAMASLPVSGKARGADRPVITVTKDPNCGCCSGWAEHLRRSGFTVRVLESNDVQAVKARLGVPEDLASCHTAEIAGYVVEGHVPAAAIDRLLLEKPKAIGLAVPGMPIGSPGMEGGSPEPYDVMLFGPDFKKTFERYRGLQRV